MSVSLIVGILAALAALVSGFFVGRRKSGLSQVVKIENKAEVERQALDKTVTDTYIKKSATVTSEANAIAGKNPSDVIADMINKGEVSR